MTPALMARAARSLLVPFCPSSVYPCAALAPSIEKDSSHALA